MARCGYDDTFYTASLAAIGRRMDKFPEIKVIRKTGTEPLHENGKPLDINLLSFWQWSASDLVGNAMRGILAEYIVSSAVGKTDGSRIE